MFIRRLPALLTAVVLAAATLLAAPRQSTFMPIDEVRPGMIGIGRTVFENDRLEKLLHAPTVRLKELAGSGQADGVGLVRRLFDL